MNRRSTWSALFPLAMALFYGASPIDLIPDVIPLIGWLDDAIIVPLLLLLAGLALMRNRSERRRSLAVVTRGSR